MRRKARRLAQRLWRGFARRAWGTWRFVAPILVAGVTAVQAEVISARYTDPTDRYAHGVLGDAIEWGTLELTLTDKSRRRIVLPQSRVFEDLEPRLFDVDQDGDLEAIVIESSARLGARLAIYDENGLLAANPFIGRSNRWLAPIGAADLDGDGHIEIAYIDRPHLAKTLRVWRFVDGALVDVTSLAGLTNHRIGENFISSGIRDCGTGPEMITADARWQNLQVTRLADERLTTEPLTRFSQAALREALACR